MSASQRDIGSGRIIGEPQAKASRGATSGGAAGFGDWDMA